MALRRNIWQLCTIQSGSPTAMQQVGWGTWLCTNCTIWHYGNIRYQTSFGPRGGCHRRARHACKIIRLGEQNIQIVSRQSNIQRPLSLNCLRHAGILGHFQAHISHAMDTKSCEPNRMKICVLSNCAFGLLEGPPTRRLTRV